MIVAMQRKLAIMAVALAAAPVVAQDEEVRQVFIDDVAQVRIETSLGNIVVELNAERAPMTVESFLQYVVDDYYDGTIFHRVAAGFIVQGVNFKPGIVGKTVKTKFVVHIKCLLTCISLKRILIFRNFFITPNIHEAKQFEMFAQNGL